MNCSFINKNTRGDITEIDVERVFADPQEENVSGCSY